MNSSCKRDGDRWKTEGGLLVCLFLFYKKEDFTKMTSRQQTEPAAKKQNPVSLWFLLSDCCIVLSPSLTHTHTHIYMYTKKNGLAQP